MQADKLSPSYGKLAQLQQVFSSGLLDASIPKPQDVVAPTADKKSDKRFSVYRNNVTVSLTEALMDTYPTILALVGEEFFRAMAPVFIAAHPPQSACLFEYGDGFGAFLDTFDPVNSLPFLGDVARLEFAWLRSYHAKDQTPLDPLSLQQVAPEALADLTLTLHPACQIVSSPHPIYDIWAAHKQPDVEQAMGQIAQYGQDCLITRPQWDVTVIALPSGGRVFIQNLADGLSLAQAAEAAASINDDFDFAQNLGGLLETGALAGFVYAE